MKKSVFLLMALLMAACLTGCGGSSAPAAKPAAKAADTTVYKIRFGVTVPDTHPSTKLARQFEKLIEERSKGRITVDVYPNNQIGGPRDLCEGLQQNTIQMCDNSPAALSGFTSRLLPLSLPFLFPSREVAFKFIDGQYGKDISEGIAKEAGMRVVAWGENGSRHLTNSIRPVTKPEDIAGMKIRVMESPMYINLFEALGASPMPMSFAELFTALQQKTVDGQDNPYGVVYSNRLYEVQAYMTDLSHVFDFAVFLISEEFYQKLPDDLKKMVMDCAKEAEVYGRKCSVDDEATFVAEIKKGVQMTTLTDEQRTVFRDRSAKVYDWFYTQYPKEKEITLKYIEEVKKLSGGK